MFGWLQFSYERIAVWFLWHTASSITGRSIVHSNEEFDRDKHIKGMVTKGWRLVFSGGYFSFLVIDSKSGHSL